MPSPLAISATWDAVAPDYTADLVPLFELYARDALALADLPDRARVLDVAAGPGTLALLAAPDADHVDAVDFSPAMVETLRQRAPAAGAANVTVAEADGQALPFEDATFDAVFSMFGLIFFPDRAAGFREALRVLTPGGRAVVSSWAPLDGIPLLAACFGALADLLPWFGSREGGLPLGDPTDFRDEMAAAGFDPVIVHTIEHRTEAASVRDFWASSARSSAPLVVLRQQLEADAWADLGEAVVARLEREFGTGPVAMAWPAHLGVGVRPAR